MENAKEMQESSISKNTSRQRVFRQVNGELFFRNILCCSTVSQYLSPLSLSPGEVWLFLFLGLTYHNLLGITSLQWWWFQRRSWASWLVDARALRVDCWLIKKWEEDGVDWRLEVASLLAWGEGDDRFCLSVIRFLWWLCGWERMAGQPTKTKNGGFNTYLFTDHHHACIGTSSFSSININQSHRSYGVSRV